MNGTTKSVKKLNSDTSGMHKSITQRKANEIVESYICTYLVDNWKIANFIREET